MKLISLPTKTQKLLLICTALFTSVSILFLNRRDQQYVAAQKNIYITRGAFGNIFDPCPFIGNAQISCYRLKLQLEPLGYAFHQVRHIQNLFNPAAIIFFDISADVTDLKQYPLAKKILFLWEPPSVDAKGYNTAFHQNFDRIYTWRDDLVDNKKYFKFYYPQPTLTMIDPIPYAHKKLCTLISCNKQSTHPHALYNQRKLAIDFFEQHHPNDFDLYGIGWPSHYTTYKGKIDKKIDYLKKYKFYICYENICNIKGYVSEKIFDAFIAGCVPIYWGAENITDYVPKNCFIDRRDFASMQELYDHIHAIPEDVYNEYIHNIKTYLASEKAQLFSTQNFINIFKQAVS